MHGLTRSGQTVERLLGYSTGVRITDIHKLQQAKDHLKVMDKAVETACKVKYIYISDLEFFGCITN